ncbi:MAG: tetratricopeptide repeat protein [bacterium]
MPTIIIPLADILIDPERPIDLAALSIDLACQYIKNSYGFLSTEIAVKIQDGVAMITLPEEKSRKVQSALEWFTRGIKKANNGDYKSAIQLFLRTLEYFPAHSDARRNLAMAYLETGNADEALNQLIDVLRLNPRDAWGYILLGNIYVKYKEDRKTGEQFYKRAYEINPDDPYLLNNYAAMKAENSQTDEARAMFEKAIRIDPSYPNSYLGLATLLSKLNNHQEGISILGQLFDHPISSDQRASIVYEHARDLYKTLNEKLCDEHCESIKNYICVRANAIRAITGYPVEIIVDDSLSGVSAMSELAWRHHTNSHRIRHRSGPQRIVPHLIMHEIKHILLEYEASEAGNNRVFVVTEQQRQYGRDQIQNELFKLDDLGLEQSEKEEIVSRWLFGLTNQLYNCPLDMIVEKRMYDKYPELRPFQFVSLAYTQREYLKVLTDSDLQKISPQSIYRASLAMNCAYALFADWLYHGATEFSKPYRSSSMFALGEKLFSSYQSKQASKQA